MTTAVLAIAIAAPSIRLEAEDAVLDGPTVSSVRTGFSGRGYVTGFTRTGSRIVWHTQAKAGIYLAKISFATPSSEKGFDFSVNGHRSSGMFPATNDKFGALSVGRVELRDGDNEISVERGWGYYDIDFVELIPAGKPPALKRLPGRLVDPNATSEARTLFSRLLKSYGTKTLSGQYDESECEFVRSSTGQIPAILGGDLMDESPSRRPFFGQNGEKMPVDQVPSWMAATRKGQILTLSWHWNAPFGLLNTPEHRWYSGFYTSATTFDVSKAMSDPHSAERKAIESDLDAIAIPLKRLAAAHVPILWRPLHEAEGGWFWWGAKGPDAAKWLYRLTYERLTQKHGLHNLIWVWNSGKADWYPGDDVVDILSVDQYPTDRRDALSPAWEDLLKRFNGRKPLALAEFPGAPDVERMRRFGVRWLYFVSWTGSVGPKATAAEVLQSTYRSPSVRNAP